MVAEHVKTDLLSQPGPNASLPTAAASQPAHVPAAAGDVVELRRTQRPVMTSHAEKLGEQGRILEWGRFGAYWLQRGGRESVPKGGVEKRS